MERKVGEIFSYKGKTYKIVLSSNISCDGCAFENGWPCREDSTIIGECTPFLRCDNKNIIFKEIKNMEIENNQLIIDIPKGMEIDIENSRLSEGIIKFKSNDINYDDIVNSFNSIACINVSVHSSEINKLKAMAQLMNIAIYYNKDWKPNWNESGAKYYIKFNSSNGKFYIDYNNNLTNGGVYFKNLDDAQSVIDNPNFREILDTIFKN